MTPDLPPLPAYIYGRECSENERVWTERDMRAYAAEAVRVARQQALEDAEQACGSVKTTRFDQARGARLCVDAIHALKDRT